MHPPILETRRLDWPDESACQALAAHLARQPALRGAVIELEGPLGAGKTTFVRHLLRALGVTGRVKSPTYAVVEPYEVDDLAISHFDFYRFDDPREWEDAGFRELFAAPGLKLVEWAGKAAPHLPVPDLRVRIGWPGGMPAGVSDDMSSEGDAAPDTLRVVELEALTPAGVALLP